MRHKKLKISAVLLFGLGLTGLQAQTIYVKQSSGTENSYVLNDIQKVTFGSGNLTVTKTDNSTGVYALSDLQYLSFADYTTGVQLANSETAIIQVYPNPVGDVLNINVPGAGAIQLLNLDGKVLQSKQVNTEGITTLATGALTKGIYLCRYCNATATKTVKIIKQ